MTIDRLLAIVPGVPRTGNQPDPVSQEGTVITE